METIFTIGHSTLELAKFVKALTANGVRRLVDVRTVPRSRHNPQYNRETLPAALAQAGIDYRHEPRLGGLRRPRKDSPNRGWRNDSFRGFADYMLTEEFAAAIGDLIEEARATPLAIMCAEAVPWRCHRSLIADALESRGVTVLHLSASGAAREHRLTPFARVKGSIITYPSEEEPPRCDRCGSLDAPVALAGRRLCTDCYYLYGSCCMEFGGDDLTAEPNPRSAS